MSACGRQRPVTWAWSVSEQKLVAEGQMPSGSPLDELPNRRRDEAQVDEAIDVAFVPVGATSLDDYSSGEVEVTLEDAPEPLVGNAIDLGAIATEFLVLGLDPYPRKPDVVFETPPAGDEPAHPFAALAGLKKGQGGGQR